MPRGSGRRRPVQITDRDRQVLAFMAEHRLVLATHVQALLGVSPAAAYARLHALRSEGLLSGGMLFHRQPAYHQITRRGLEAIGSRLPLPQHPDLREYRHDVGLAWIFLAARAGTFGALREVVGERRMRSLDAIPDREAPPLAVRLGGFGARGRERLHYPDLLLHTAAGHQVAIELELTGKGRTRRETILGGYAADSRVDAVIYFVDKLAVGRPIQHSARKLGISPLVRVQRCVWVGRTPGRPAGSAPTRPRMPAPRHGLEAGR
jgi:hypothetical protein